MVKKTLGHVITKGSVSFHLSGERHVKRSVPPATTLDAMETPASSVNGNTTPASSKAEKQPWRPANPLETAPVNDVHRPHGTLPNTPLAVSLISFLLGLTFTLGVILCASGGLDGSRWLTSNLGFFVASLGAFHWAEFVVTAGWNRDKVSVDCKQGLSSSILLQPDI